MMRVSLRDHHETGPGLGVWGIGIKTFKNVKDISVVGATISALGIFGDVSDISLIGVQPADYGVYYTV